VNAPSAAPSRKRFALTGRSQSYDPLTTAVRPDLADVRLADRIFAPHYAAPMACVLVQSATLLAGKGGEAIAELAAGEQFEVLEVSGAHAWGVTQDGRVGYVDRGALVVA
jgi:hypothetical protein